MIARLSIDLKDHASEPLQRQMAALTPQEIGTKIGPRLREFTVRHLLKNPRNKRGWPSTGFWEDAARGTTWEVPTDGGLLIRIEKIGITQRYYGGTITAIKAEMLTIPIASQAYGKSAKEFPGAFLITTPKGAYIVRYAGGNTPTGRFKKQHATLEFLFKLKRSVKQQGNRNIIPSHEAYVAEAIAALTEYFRKVKTGGAA